jgi:hypothetical protein
MITAARQVPEPPSSVSRSILLVAYGRIGQSGAISDCVRSTILVRWQQG